jgi:hypothetical protein
MLSDNAVRRSCPTGMHHCVRRTCGAHLQGPRTDVNWPSLGDQCLQLLARVRHLRSCEGRGGVMLSDNAVGRCCRTALSDGGVRRVSNTFVGRTGPTHEGPFGRLAFGRLLVTCVCTCLRMCATWGPVERQHEECCRTRLSDGCVGPVCIRRMGRSHGGGAPCRRPLGGRSRPAVA